MGIDPDDLMRLRGHSDDEGGEEDDDALLHRMEEEMRAGTSQEEMSRLLRPKEGSDALMRVHFRDYDPANCWVRARCTAHAHCVVRACFLHLRLSLFV